MAECLNDLLIRLLTVSPTWQACCYKVITCDMITSLYMTSLQHSAPVNLCGVTELCEQGLNTIPVGIPNQLLGEWCRSAYRLRQVGGAGEGCTACTNVISFCSVSR